MKKILSISSICLSIFLVSVVSSNAADMKSYTGLNYMFISYEPDGVSDIDLGAFGLKLGVDINDYIGVEMRAGLGVDDDTVNVLGVDVDVEINYFYSVYARPKYRMNQIQIYGLLGFTKAELEASAFGVSVEEDDTDFSYGLGLEWFFNDNASASIEYMQLFDESDYEVESFNIGLTYYF